MEQDLLDFFKKDSFAALAGAVNSHGVLTFSTTSNITCVKSVSEGRLYAEATEIVNHKRMPYAEVRMVKTQAWQQERCLRSHRADEQSLMKALSGQTRNR